MASSASLSKFHVFISHAGEDKATIALPLREMLRTRGISAFVDEKDIPPGSEATQEMINAMETAQVGVIVLSPEFIARKWPMKELLCFLKRREQAISQVASYPVVIPLFYRLRVSELYQEPRFDRNGPDGENLYGSSRFFQRMNNGEPEADIETIKDALRTLHGIMGVRNDVDATNGSEHVMSMRREIVLQMACDTIVQSLFKSNGVLEDQDLPVAGNKFRRYFVPVRRLEAVLDFKSTGSDGVPITPETRVKQRVLDRSTTSRRITSILGSGGVGKSTILKGLANDNDIRNEFSDGVHVISLGMDAVPTTLFQQVCKMLRDSGAVSIEAKLQGGNDVDTAIREAISWFREKNCLFLIDDVWSANIGLGRFSNLCDLLERGQRSAVVMTTRKYETASLAPREGILRVTPRETHGKDSYKMLFLHAGLTENDLQDACANESIDEILRICSGLPVTLAAAGKSVKMIMIDMKLAEIDVWAEFMTSLRICRARLLRENVGAYGNLYATFAASIAFLEQRQEEKLGFETKLKLDEMHRRLCVLRRQAKVPAAMLRHLWEVESESHAMIVGMRFAQVGLAESEYERVGKECVWKLRIHDSLQDFASSEANRHGENAQTHENLLRGYSACDVELWSSEENRTKWWSTKLKDDGYIHRNLCRHLREAGRMRELIELLKTPEWIARNLDIRNFFNLDTDFRLGIEALLKMKEEKDAESETVLRLVQAALKLCCGFITRNVKELWFQLFGRLIGHRDECEGIDKYLKRMERRAREPWLRCINPFLEDPGGSTKSIIPVGASVSCMAVVKGKDRIACGCSDGRAVIVDLMRGAVEKEWPASEGEFTAIASPHGITAIASEKRGKRVVTGGGDGSAKVWDMSTVTCTLTFRGHSSRVNSMTILPDNQKVISASKDGTLQVWDIETGQELTIIEGDGWFQCAGLLPDAQHVISGGDDGILRLWNLTSGSQVGKEFRRHEGAVTCVAVTPDGQLIVSGSNDTTVRIWRAATGSEISRLQVSSTLSTQIGFSNTVTSVCISGDGRSIVSGYSDGKMRLWDAESGSQFGEALHSHTSDITGVSFVAASDVVSCSMEGNLRVCDLMRLGDQAIGPRQKYWAWRVSFSPNGRRAISSSFDLSWDWSLRIWDTTSGQQIGKALCGHTALVTDFVVTPDGDRVVSCSYDKTVRIWDLNTRNQLRELLGHTAPINCIALMCDGNVAITGSADRTVRLWDLTATDWRHTTLEGHTTSVMRVLVSKNEQRIISAGADTEILVWDIRTRQMVKRVLQRLQIQPWKLSSQEIMSLAGDVTEESAAQVDVVDREIRYGRGKDAVVLGTMESYVTDWALSPDQKTLYVGLEGGQIVFLKIEIPDKTQ